MFIVAAALLFSGEEHRLPPAVVDSWRNYEKTVLGLEYECDYRRFDGATLVDHMQFVCIDGAISSSGDVTSNWFLERKYTLRKPGSFVRVIITKDGMFKVGLNGERERPVLQQLQNAPLKQEHRYPAFSGYLLQPVALSSTITYIAQLDSGAARVTAISGDEKHGFEVAVERTDTGRSPSGAEVSLGYSDTISVRGAPDYLPKRHIVKCIKGEELARPFAKRTVEFNYDGKLYGSAFPRLIETSETYDSDEKSKGDITSTRKFLYIGVSRRKPEEYLPEQYGLPANIFRKAPVSNWNLVGVITLASMLLCGIGFALRHWLRGKIR